LRAHPRGSDRDEDRGRQRFDGSRADPAAERAHWRSRVFERSSPTQVAAGSGGGEVRICIVGCGAVGSLFAANLARLDDVEVWAYDLSQPHVDAINANGLRLTGAGDVHAELRATT